MRRLALLLILTAVALAPPAGAGEPAPAKAKVYAVVFDFTCPHGAYGRQLSDSVRLRLRRHEEYDVLDRLSTQEASGPLGADARKTVIKLMDSLAANLAVYGSVSRQGAQVRAEVSCIDLTDVEGKGRQWIKVFTDSGERARGNIAMKIVEAIRGQAEWVPPQYGDEEEPKNLAQALNANGGFEKGRAGWDRPDNVSTFIEQGPAGRGKILRIRTDLARGPWLEYKRALMFGQADPGKPPKIARDTSYGSVAGLEGVHFASEWIKATPGRRYWMVADFNGKTAGAMFPKIFVKGFRKTEHALDGLPETSLAALGLTPKQFARLPARKRKELIAEDARKNPMRYVRECYRWYLACRNEEGGWRHFAAPCPPRGGLPDYVEWLQIQVYAYWPPGTYCFDNVHLYADPNQKAPAPEEKARTPNLGKTSDVVERATSRPSK